MTPVGTRSGAHPDYLHALLVHDTDEELVEVTRAFTTQGLTSGGRVLVHGTRDRVRLMRRFLGTDSRLEYGLDEDLYVSPTATLFAYQSRLAAVHEEMAEDAVLWVTGTVPLGADTAAQGAWNRYEAVVDEALASFPFRALCTYDLRTRRASVIAAAMATHAVLTFGLTSRVNPDHVDPRAFLADPMAQAPVAPTGRPSVATTVLHPDDLARARFLVGRCARRDSAVPLPTIERFQLAVHEVAANGLFHGGAPVQVYLWVDVGTLTCRVVDSGRGGLDALTGYRWPGEADPVGLWVARQSVADLLIADAPAGGCSVLLVAR